VIFNKMMTFSFSDISNKIGAPTKKAAASHEM